MYDFTCIVNGDVLRDVTVRVEFFFLPYTALLFMMTMRSVLLLYSQSDHECANHTTQTILKNVLSIPSKTTALSVAYRADSRDGVLVLKHT